MNKIYPVIAVDPGGVPVAAAAAAATAARPLFSPGFIHDP